MGPKTDLRPAPDAAKYRFNQLWTSRRGNVFRRLLCGTTLGISTTPITVYVIDDDDGVRRALGRMFKSAGFLSHQFRSSGEMLATTIDSQRACVIADLNIVGDEPLGLPGLLESRSIDLPVVYISADDSDTNRAKVQSSGGFGLFRKPVDDQALIDAVRWAVERQGARR